MRQSEFVKEIKAFREFYEEKEVLLRNRHSSLEEDWRRKIALAQEQAKKAKLYLDTVFDALKIGTTEKERLIRAMKGMTDAKAETISGSIEHHVLDAQRSSDVSYYSIELGKLELFWDDIKSDLVPTDVTESLSRVRDSLMPMAKSDGKTIEIIVKSSVKKVIATRSTLDSAFYEIVKNAIAYSPAGAKVQVNASQRDPYRVEVLISNLMADRLQESLDQLFLPGRRGKLSTKFLPEGRGLGLFLSRKLIELIGATIEAEVKGEHFVVTLFLPTTSTTN